MPDESLPSSSPNTARPVVRKRRWQLSLIWLVPIVAALIGLSMVVHDWMSAGPQVTVSFKTAEGLEANKTQVKYKNVVIGLVSKIALSEDNSQVIATIDLNEDAQAFTREGTHFWVVRPRIGARGISGVDTLLSGAFISADAGSSEKTRRDFTGLENPPPVTFGEKGKRFTLHTDDLGSLDIGSPVYYRRIQVGQVVGYKLADDGKAVDIEIFVNAPNDIYVTQDTRFWNASGVDISLDANGLKIATQSISSVVAGGLAFRAPRYSPTDAPAADYAEFNIFDDQATAMAPPDGDARYIKLRFVQSLRGLAVGAPVDFLGVNIGRVVSVDLDYDAKTKTFPSVVGAVIFPQRLGAAHEKLVKQMGGETEEQTAALLSTLVERGLRAQARTGNLLTGQLYIAMSFEPHPSKVVFDPKARPLEIPTVAGSFDKLQEQLQAIVDKFSKLPIEELAANLNTSIAELQKTLKQVNADVLPEMRGTLQQAQATLATANDALAEDSPSRQQLGQSLEEVQRTARSVRVLTDYLSRHPEALIRGRSGDAGAEAFKAAPSSREIQGEAR